MATSAWAQAGGECLCDGGVGDGHTLVQIAGIGPDLHRLAQLS